MTMLLSILEVTLLHICLCKLPKVVLKKKLMHGFPNLNSSKSTIQRWAKLILLIGYWVPIALQYVGKNGTYHKSCHKRFCCRILAVTLCSC